MSDVNSLSSSSEVNLDMFRFLLKEGLAGKKSLTRSEFIDLGIRVNILAGCPSVADLVFDLLLSYDNPKEKEISVKVVDSYISSLETFFDSNNINEKWNSIKTSLNLPGKEHLILSEDCHDYTKFPVIAGSIYLSVRHLIFRAGLLHNLTVIPLKDILAVKKTKYSNDHFPEFTKSWSLVNTFTDVASKISYGSCMEISFNGGYYKFSFDGGEIVLNRWLNSVNELLASYNEQSANGLTYAIYLPKFAYFNLVRTAALTELNKREATSLLIFSRLDEVFYKNLSTELYKTKFEDKKEKWMHEFVSNHQIKSDELVGNLKTQRAFDVGIFKDNVVLFFTLVPPFFSQFVFVSYILSWEETYATLLALFFCISLWYYDQVHTIPVLFLWSFIFQLAWRIFIIHRYNNIVEEEEKKKGDFILLSSSTSAVSSLPSTPLITPLREKEDLSKNDNKNNKVTKKETPSKKGGFDGVREGLNKLQVIQNQIGGMVENIGKIVTLHKGNHSKFSTPYLLFIIVFCLALIFIPFRHVYLFIVLLSFAKKFIPPGGAIDIFLDSVPAAKSWN